MSSVLEFAKEAGVLTKIRGAAKKYGKLYALGEALSTIPGGAAGAHHAMAQPNPQVHQVAGKAGAGALASKAVIPGGGILVGGALLAKKRKKKKKEEEGDKPKEASVLEFVLA